MYHQD